MKTKNKSLPKLTGHQVQEEIQKLIDSRTVRKGKPVILFGPTIGVVREVTASMAGNLTLIYDEYKPRQRR